MSDIDNKDHSYIPTGNGGYTLLYKGTPSDGEKVCFMLAERDSLIQSLTSEASSLQSDKDMLEAERDALREALERIVNLASRKEINKAYLLIEAKEVEAAKQALAREDKT